MNYRADIDGLRAVAVIAVVIFHADIDILSGGYVGVDIFFVISGFLITGLIFNEVIINNFSYFTFYKRRIARLLPSLIITLFIVFIFGFIFYDNKSFDSLGKEIFFSSIGAANILFGQGVNYFAQDAAVRPLMHLWSLGVEEQFYLIWPTILILLMRLKKTQVLVVISLLSFASFYMAFIEVKKEPIVTYFYPQYRAFELLIGAFVFIEMQCVSLKKMHFEQKYKEVRETISYAAIALIIIPMFILNKESTFPGINTLYPTIGAALFIAFSYQTTISKLFSSAPFVIVGLISYPLYLYHQPIISYLYFFNLSDNRIILFFITVLISVPLSWLTYKYIEKPIRRIAHNKDRSSIAYVVPLTACMAFFAISGLYVAKNNGIPERFKILNPFAFQASKHSEFTFYTYFKQGVVLSKKSNGKTLFIGDSLSQQYVYPFSNALNLNLNDIDTITKGGCVLLKGVEFMDKFSDISCNDIRDTLYKMDAHYENVVISQDWDSYNDSIFNIQGADRGNPLSKWTPFIDQTVAYFKTRARKIIIIGRHIRVEGTSRLKPTIFLTSDNYKNNLKKLRVSNIDDLLDSRAFFNNFDNVLVIHPLDIWSQENVFKLHDNNWSFFRDNRHVSSASTTYLENRFKSILIKNQIKSTYSEQKKRHEKFSE